MIIITRAPLIFLRARIFLQAAVIVVASMPLAGRQISQGNPSPAPAAGVPELATEVRTAPVPTASSVPAPTPPDYVIGVDDLLSIVFWRDKDLSTDALVRPDGKISMPLLNDIQAEGLTPIQLRNEISAEAKQYVQDPNVTIVVRQINSRKVFITGEVEKPGSYPLTAQMTVLQLIATAGGLKEYADAKHIAVVRTENGHQISYPFNFKDVTNPEMVKQNINLKPGDAVIVR